MAEQFFILIRINKHWMVYTRSEGKQIYSTREAADDDSRELRSRKAGMMGRSVYADVIVKSLSEDSP